MQNLGLVGQVCLFVFVFVFFLPENQKSIIRGHVLSEMLHVTNSTNQFSAMNYLHMSNLQVSEL